MLSHIGSVLPSGLRDLSKSITSTIARELSLAPVEARPEPKKNTRDAPTIDVDVLLSYYAHSNEHRPSSRLLKERRSKGSRSAKLLVPGSPAFERPWRVPSQVAKRDKSRSSSSPIFSASAGPKTAVALTGGRSRRSCAENRISLSLHGRASDGQDCDGQMELSSSQQHLQHQQEIQQPTEAGSVSQAAEAYRIRSERSGGGCAQATPKAPRSGVEETQPIPQLQPTEVSLATGEKRDAARAKGSFERRENDETHENSDYHSNTAPSLQESKGLPPKRPSTAPAMFEKLLHLPGHDSVGAERGVQGSPLASTAREDPATATPACGEAEPFNGSTSHRIACSVGGSKRSDDDSDGGSLRCTPQKLRERDPPEEMRPHDATAMAATPAHDAEHLPAANPFDAELDLLLPVNLRPSTAEGQRRSTIELDATLSRSSRLPPPSCSLTLGSEDGFTLLTGSMTGELGRSNNGGGGWGAREGEGYLAAAGASADIGAGVDITITGLAGQSAKTRSSGHKRGARSSSRGGGGEGGQSSKSTMRRPLRRQRGGKTGQPHRHRHRKPGHHSSAGGSGSRPMASDSQMSSITALGRANGTAWTEWRRPGELGELDLQADSLHSTNRRGGNWKTLGRATNGAASGVGWGGNDQMMRVAAAPKASKFGGGEKPLTLATDPVEEQRPDTRERFYEAPVERLRALHPCFRCFDALMHHFRAGGMEGGALGGHRQAPWSFSAAARDPHVAFFVRWESLDRELGRYIPRGFAGSFTPRPFRPALTEYAVKAAHDPKFWGLGWAQLPDTRCRVVVVKSLEVAQHERDWLSNRHGLILSFEDAAGRHHQAAMFPETMCKAGWNKEHTIDALFRKAGYRARRPRTEINTPSSSAAAPPGGGGGVAGRNHDDPVHDPVVARTAVFLRFETVSFRMEFCKYQRAKAAAHEFARS